MAAFGVWRKKKEGKGNVGKGRWTESSSKTEAKEEKIVVAYFGVKKGGEGGRDLACTRVIWQKTKSLYIRDSFSF